MAARQRVFGRLDDDTPVHAVTLGDDQGLRAEVLAFGGILRSLSLPTARGRTELVLGLPDLQDYRRDSAYLGVIAGRFANRIAGARFAHDGRAYRLDANAGDHHLHGGNCGFGRRLWRILDHDGRRLRLGYRSPAGEAGYPGTLAVEATYSIGDSTLELLLEACADAPTPVNLTGHAYFNLAGDPAVPADAQVLSVAADRYLPVADGALIPTGEIAPVAGTPFDFRRARRIAGAAVHPQLVHAGGYDHCLVMAEGQRCRARLASPHSGVVLDLDSPMPALQLYEGQGLDRQHPGLGRGICLEPQGYPNAPNEPRFPGAILEPGQVYSHLIRYRLSADG
ncbi:aldose epimerase family protein [Luteimonas suaedae]|uniref:aldose epimerase family protein n=1 Tax=Luteimonas suaedae TaxID=2605430 RepID=UPI0011EEDA74|nr:aldose epimerase family protein [Luteimonas suaedae]